MNCSVRLAGQKIEIETGHCNLIVYTDATLNWAVSLACDLREKGKCIELLKREPWQERQCMRNTENAEVRTV